MRSRVRNNFVSEVVIVGLVVLFTLAMSFAASAQGRGGYYYATSSDKTGDRVSNTYFSSLSAGIQSRTIGKHLGGPPATILPSGPFPTREKAEEAKSRRGIDKLPTFDVPDPLETTEAPINRTGERPSGMYRVERDTQLRSEPRANASVVTELPRGTKVRVVSQTGSYLEVQSRQGRAPGYVLQQDVVFLRD